MASAAQIVRGTIFRAEHDSSFDFWESAEPRKKFCIAFNLSAITEKDDVHYFICTKDVSRFRENTSLLSDCLIVPKGSYNCFPLETAIDTSYLCVVPFAKLNSKGLKVVGTLTATDVQKLESIVSGGRILVTRSRKLLGL